MSCICATNETIELRPLGARVTVEHSRREWVRDIWFVWTLLVLALVSVIRLGGFDVAPFEAGSAASWWLDALFLGPVAWVGRHSPDFELNGRGTFIMFCALPGLRAAGHALGLRVLCSLEGRLGVALAWGLQCLGLGVWIYVVGGMTTLSQGFWLSYVGATAGMYMVLAVMQLTKPMVRQWRVESMAGMFAFEHFVLTLIVGLFLGDLPI